jgi:hypothetical protein
MGLAARLCRCPATVDNGRVRRNRSAAEGVQDTTNATPHATRVLALLVVGVTLAHLALLQALPASSAPPDKARTRAFTTRTIVLQPPAVALAPPPAATPAPAPPRPKPRPRPRPLPKLVEPAVDPAVLSATPPPAEPNLPAEPNDAPEAPDQTTVAATPEAAPTESQSPQAAASAPDGAASAAPPPPESAAQPASLALAIPGSVRIRYTVTGEHQQQTYHAFGEMLWLQDGQTYDLSLGVSAFFYGERVRSSTGTITERGLTPTRFSDKWRRRNLAAHFERDKGEVSFSANTPRAPLLPDAQDQLSVLMQLASLVAGDPGHYPAGSTITFPVVGPRDTDTWSFTLQGHETLYLPTAGQTDTLRLTRNPRRQFDQKVEAWLAPGMAYLPVRVRITQADASFMDLIVRSTEAP